MSNKKQLTPTQLDFLYSVLEKRFNQNMNRHKGMQWEKVKTLISKKPNILWSLNEMEKTGGEPDVVKFDKKSGITFCDCSIESPKGRRSICYDEAALKSRKEHKPKNSASGMATAMGIELLTEKQYRELQNYGEFDTKTSSWLQTPAEIRKLGGAIFADYRFGNVFVYHNGAESYYAGRGFRGVLEI